MITYDRYFLDNVVIGILGLGREKYFPYEGNYSTHLEKKAKRMEQEEREESGRQTAIRHELEWIRQGAKARQTKSKARIASSTSWSPRRRNTSPARRKSSSRSPSGLAARLSKPEI